MEIVAGELAASQLIHMAHVDRSANVHALANRVVLGFPHVTGEDQHHQRAFRERIRIKVGAAATTYHEFMQPGYAGEHVGKCLERSEIKAVSVTRITQAAYLRKAG